MKEKPVDRPGLEESSTSSNLLAKRVIVYCTNTNYPSIKMKKLNSKWKLLVLLKMLSVDRQKRLFESSLGNPPK